jgi:ferredoxin
MSLFTIDPEKCNRCGMCVLECPARIITAREPKSVPVLVEGGEERCIICGHCVAVCAPGAFAHSFRPRPRRSVC